METVPAPSLKPAASAVLPTVMPEEDVLFFAGMILLWLGLMYGTHIE